MCCPALLTYSIGFIPLVMLTNPVGLIKLVEYAGVKQLAYCILIFDQMVKIQAATCILHVDGYPGVGGGCAP